MNEKKHYIIPLFVPFSGCPHHCIFCDQEKITGVGQGQQLDVEKIIESYLETICQNNSLKKIEAAFYGGSFTGLPFSVQRELLAVTAHYKKMGRIDEIRLSTRPDFINQEVLELLKVHGVTTVELGVQSLDDQVLQAAHRGHTSQDVFRAVGLLKAHNFNLGIQLMVGLPEDTHKKAMESAKQTVALKPNFVRIYPTLILKGTELANLYQQGLFHPWSLDQAIAVCKQMYYLFEQNGIPIIRLGLQHTEELGREHLIAGPYHPAMGELVQGAVFLDMLVYLLDKTKKDFAEKEIFIYCAPQDLSKVKGHKNVNINSLQKIYHSTTFYVKASQSLEKDSIGISSSSTKEPEFFLNKQEFIGSQRI